MALPPLTIKNPETLAQRLDMIDIETTDKARETNESKVHTVRINGYMVTFTVTAPKGPTGRFYGMFRAGKPNDPMKKLSKEKLLRVLMENKPSN